MTGTPLTGHFEATTSPIADYRLVTIGVNLPREILRPRIAARVAQQFDRGVVDEVRALVASGVPPAAHAFSGLVYRQIIEMLRGDRDEPATRELIVQENMRYARRQLVWFRGEKNIHWFEGDDSLAARAIEFLRQNMKE